MYKQTVNITPELKKPANQLLTLYPNPASGVIQVYFSMEPGETATASCYDAVGRLQQTFVEVQPGQKLEVSRFPAGLYWLQIRTKRQVWMGRLFKREA